MMKCDQTLPPVEIPTYNTLHRWEGKVTHGDNQLTEWCQCSEQMIRRGERMSYLRWCELECEGRSGVRVGRYGSRCALIRVTEPPVVGETQMEKPL